MKYNGGWSLTEAYNLPVGLRNWFVKRLLKQIKDENEAVERASKGGGSGSQELTSFNQPEMPTDLAEVIKKTEIVRFRLFLYLTNYFSIIKRAF